MLLSPSARTCRPQHGFTLIELMITVVIVGILAAIAYPSYLQYIRQSRRSDAVQALAAVQQAQERWRANNTAYASSLGASGVATPNTTYYTIAIPAANAASYAVTATANAGTSQAGDSGCTTLTVTVSNGNASNTPVACWKK